MARLADNRNSEPEDFRRQRFDMERELNSRLDQDLKLEALLESLRAPAVVPQPQVQISCLAPAARAVFVAGTFNQWSATATPMARTHNGGWSATLTLPPGRYEYKFVVDGRWCCDPAVNEDAVRQKPPVDWVGNGMGSFNRVVEVGASAAVGGRK
ncbi:MAG: glycogen-binding domain-containing protein [Phycisphaeraceae bacterium]